MPTHIDRLIARNKKEAQKKKKHKELVSRNCITYLIKNHTLPTEGNYSLSSTSDQKHVCSYTLYEERVLPDFYKENTNVQTSFKTLESIFNACNENDEFFSDQFQNNAESFLNNVDVDTIIYMANYIHLFVLDMFYINIKLFHENQFGTYWNDIPCSHQNFHGEYEDYFDRYKFCINGATAESGFFYDCLSYDNQYNFNIDVQMNNLNWYTYED